jgi:drug/metabolite transporter (DMT)-like permease
MKTPAETPIVSMVLVLVASFFGSIGASFLKAGAGKLHGGLRYLFFNWQLAVGVALFLSSSVLYVLGVKRGQLSVLYPLVSLSYIWALVWARIFFKEAFTRRKLAGLCLILLGILFVGLGNR